MTFLELIGKVVSEFARLILFVASIIMLICSILFLTMSYQSHKNFAHMELKDMSTILTIVVCCSIYLIVLSALGIFASFFSARSMIKLLVIMMVINVAIGVVVLATLSSKQKSLDEALVKRLEEDQKKYDWDNKNNTDALIKDATTLWDGIQKRLGCCGVHSPDDWAPYAKDKNLLPSSCCIEEPKTGTNCDRRSSKFWTDGCSNELELGLVVVEFGILTLVVVCVAIILLASIVLCCKPECCVATGALAGLCICCRP